MTTVAVKTVDSGSLVFAVDLPLSTPSQNELMAWKHQPSLRQWKYPQFKKHLAKLLAEAFDGSPLFQAGKPSKMRLTVTRYSVGTLDDGNLRGGCKPLLDALVDLGVLHDDSPKWLEDHYHQEKAPKGTKRTRLEIEAL